jgi:hypothetical protein
MDSTQGREAKGRLASSMEFLRLEMEGEERINLATTSLGLTPEAPAPIGKKKHSSKQCPKEDVPTAAGLLSAMQTQEAKPKCVL